MKINIYKFCKRINITRLKFNKDLLFSLMPFSGPLFLAVSIALFLFVPDHLWIAYVILIISAVSFLFHLFTARQKIIDLFLKRGTQQWVNAAVSVVLIFGILVFINYIGSNHLYKIDLTRGKLNTLSDQTVKVLDKMKDKVEVIAFVNQVGEGQLFNKYMEMLKYHTDKIKYRVVDPNKEPLQARTFGVTKYGTIVFVSSGNEVRIDKLTEEDMTNALIKLSRKNKKVVYFLDGHGERNIDSLDDDVSGYSLIKNELEGQSYTVSKLDLLSKGDIPVDCKLLVIAGPTKKFFKEELQKINLYLKKGGSLIILSDPAGPRQKVTAGDNVAPILEERGVSLRNDIIVDPISRLFGVGEAMPVIQRYDSGHKITEGFSEATFFPFAQSIDSSKASSKGYIFTVLGKSSSSSWGELGAKSGKISFNQGVDHKGPLAIFGVLKAKEEKGDKAKDSSVIVLFGNSNFITNQFVNHAGNADLFLNTIAFLLEDDDLISIRPKQDEAGKFEMPGNKYIPMLTVYLLPALILITGIVLWYRRRRS